MRRLVKNTKNLSVRDVGVSVGPETKGKCVGRKAMSKG